MKKNLKVLLSIFFVFSLLLSACGTTENNTSNNNQTQTETAKNNISDNRTIRVNNTGVYVDGVTTIIEKKQLLEKYMPEGIKVEYSDLATGPDIRDALLSDNIDIAAFSLMTFITSHENNLPISLISYSGSTPISLYSNNEDIKSLEDFKNGDVITITNKSTNLHVAFLAKCKEDMGDATKLDENLTPIPAADAIAALQAGSTDYAGAIFSFPMLNKAEQIESLSLISNMNDVIKEYGIGSVIVARDKFYEENPDLIDAFLSAQEEALKFIDDNPEEAAEILAEKFNCEASDVLKVIKEMPATNKVIGYDKQAQLLYEAGILEKEPDKFENLKNYDSIIK